MKIQLTSEEVAFLQEIQQAGPEGLRVRGWHITIGMPLPSLLAANLVRVVEGEPYPVDVGTEDEGTAHPQRAFLTDDGATYLQVRAEAEAPVPPEVRGVWSEHTVHGKTFLMRVGTATTEGAVIRIKLHAIPCGDTLTIRDEVTLEAPVKGS